MGLNHKLPSATLYDPISIPYNYKFGDKELQETGFYDFGARNYMPDVGRWFNIDPMAELAPDLSPFRFAFNNPVSFTDPDGMYENGYGGGDYYDDSDKNQFNGIFEINPHWTGPSRSHGESSDLLDAILLRWSPGIDIRSGWHDSSASQSDFAQDMAMENSSADDGPGPKKPSLSERTSDWVYKNFTSHIVAAFTPDEEGRAFLDGMRSYSTDYMRGTVGGAYRDAASYGIVGQGLESLNVGSFLGRTRAAQKALRSFDDILSNPKALWGKSAKEVGKILGEGWEQAPLNSGNGWKFTQKGGDGFVSYTTGNSHHPNSVYYKINSGASGKTKVVGKGYMPTKGDKSKIIYAY